MAILNTILNSKLRNRLLRTLVLSLLCAGFTFQFPISPAFAEKSPDEILAGVHRNFPPQYSIDEKTGKPTGFAVDIMDEVARRAGLKVRYVIFNEWPQINQALKEGRIDIIPNSGIIEERKVDYDFTSPVEVFDINIFVRETTTAIYGIDDLQGRKVAVVRDNKGLFIIKEYGKAKPVIFNSFDEALLSLLSGNTDALVYPGPPVLNVARKSQLFDRIKTVGKPLIEVKRAIAVGKGKTELLNKLDTAVKELIPTQEYKKIYANWYGAPSPYWNARRVLILAGVVLVLVIVIFAVWYYLSLMRLNRDLQYSLEEQKKAEEKIKASLLEKETMLMEIYHRVKNNMQLISSLLGLQSSYLQDEKAREVLQNSIDRVKTMADIHNLLYHAADLARIDLGSFIRDLTGRLQQSYYAAESPVDVHVDASDVSLTIEMAIPCGLILNELVSNALKHAFPEGKGGEINITMRLEDNQVALTVQDNGMGLPDAVDFQNTQSLGLELVNLLVGQLNGTISLEVDGGTTFTIIFPAGEKGG